MRAFLWITFAVAVATAATGCFVGTNAPGDDGGDDDGGGGGLTIEWNGQPGTIPSEPSSDITIDRAVFHLDGLRLVGDVGPIDLDRDQLEWSRGVVPTVLPVTGALPGLYSRLLFDLDVADDGEGYAYEITGTVKVNDSLQPYTIRDTGDLTISLDFSILLPAGGTATIPVRIAINKMVEVINFSQVSVQDGRYLVDNASPQISNLRAAVRAAFGVSGPS